jgi:hypothetical protein
LTKPDASKRSIHSLRFFMFPFFYIFLMVQRPPVPCMPYGLNVRHEAGTSLAS